MDDEHPEKYVTPSPFLQTFIDKFLRITTTDTRLFVGELKCTDRDKNLILSSTYEYRLPNTSAVEDAASGTPAAQGKVKVDMSSRYIGMVVIPGQYIVKIEVEEKAPMPPKRTIGEEEELVSGMYG